MLKAPIIPREIFRAYDIRGIVDQTLTVDTVEYLGSAIGTHILQHGEHQVVVGRDGRLSGERLQKALIQGLLATGINVVDIGPVPTPLLYFATHYLNIPSGIMITGSHNPPDYNGFKIVMGGKAIYGKEILDLYHTMVKQQFLQGQGSYSQQAVLHHYIQNLCTKICLKKPFKIVVDAGNGITGLVLSAVYEALGCEVVPLFCEVDGRFPNHHPDPGQPDNLRDLMKAVHHYKADLGLAFDGDGDRLGVVDNEGTMIWPDRILMLFARQVLHQQPQANIIFDVKCTRHLGSFIHNLGGTPWMWKTGHSLIKAKMREIDAPLAGEMSGHFFFKAWYGFDDALYAGASLLEMLSEAFPVCAADLFKTLPNSFSTPEIILGIAEEDKFSTLKKLIALAYFKEGTLNTIDGLRVDFQDGFGLVRCSNTGPNLIVRFEGDTPEALVRIQRAFAQLLHAVNPGWILPF